MDLYFILTLVVVPGSSLCWAWVGWVVEMDSTSILSHSLAFPPMTTPRSYVLLLQTSTRHPAQTITSVSSSPASPDEAIAGFLAYGGRCPSGVHDIRPASRS